MNLFKKIFKKKYDGFHIQEIFELPSCLDPKTIYVIKEGAQKLHASMICPCGCLQVIHLNLLKDADPYWRIRKGKNGSVNLSPSIWRTSGCKSHFFIRSGKVVWAKSFTRNSKSDYLGYTNL